MFTTVRMRKTYRDLAQQKAHANGFFLISYLEKLVHEDVFPNGSAFRAHPRRAPESK